MHQHSVEIAAHALDDIAVPLRVVAHHHDVAHRTYEARTRRCRAHRRDQWLQLEAKGAARKREPLDDYGVRTGRREGLEQIRAPLLPKRVVDRPARAIDQLETCVECPYRRQLDESN